MENCCLANTETYFFLKVVVFCEVILSGMTTHVIDSIYFTGLNDVSFTRPISRGSFGQSPLPASSSVINPLSCSIDQSLNQSWIFYNYTTAADSSLRDNSTYAANPNKAVVTVNARTTEVCGSISYGSHVCQFIQN